MLSDDALNEYMVDLAYHQMMIATDEEGQRHWCDRLTHYVRLRSPERVREMERERGLN